jgi:hypothetical protein
VWEGRAESVGHLYETVGYVIVVIPRDCRRIVIDMTECGESSGPPGGGGRNSAAAVLLCWAAGRSELLRPGSFWATGATCACLHLHRGCSWLLSIDSLSAPASNLHRKSAAANAARFHAGGLYAYPTRNDPRVTPRSRSKTEFL